MGKRWTKQDEKFIKDNWREMSDKDIAEKLGRTNNAIRNRRQKLDIKRPSSHCSKFNNGLHWNKEKTEYLKQNYGEMKVKDIAAELNTTKQAVKDKASKLSITEKEGKWDKDEIHYLKQNYGPNSNNTAKEIAKKLDRSLDSVQNKIKNEGLSYVEQKSFTKQELEFLEESYEDFTHKELAKKLDRHKATVTNQLNRMNLIKTPQYSQEEKNFIEDNWQELSDHEIAEKLDRSVVSIRKKRRSLDCKRDTFVNTEKHWKWEETCEKAAKEIYNNVETQKVFENNLRADIYVKSKNLVIDAKTSCYRGLNDLKKYEKCENVDKVLVWSMRPVTDTNNAVKVLDINDLQQKVSFDIKSNLNKENLKKQKKVVSY